MTSRDTDVESPSSCEFERREETSVSGNQCYTGPGLKGPTNRISGQASAGAHVTSGPAGLIDVPVMPVASPSSTAPTPASHQQPHQDPQPSLQAAEASSASSSSPSSSSSSSSCSSAGTTGSPVHLSSQTPQPPVAPPRYHRSSSHASVSRGTGSKVLDPESRQLGNKVSSSQHQHELQDPSSTMRGSSAASAASVSSINNNNSSNNGKVTLKQGLRQRQPALLLQPVHQQQHATPTPASCSKSIGSTSQTPAITCQATAATTMHGYPAVGSSPHILQSQSSTHSVKTSPVSSLMPSTFWTGNRYPSESEFDTTRLDAYISSFANRAAILSSAQQQQLQQLQNQQFLLQQQHQHRGLRRSSKTQHNNMTNRSKSVDRSLKLMSAMGQGLSQRHQLHLMLPASALPRYHHHQHHSHLSPYHEQHLHHQHHVQQHGSNQYHGYVDQHNKHSLSKIMTSLRNVSLHSGSRGHENRALIVSRSESLNSSDPESGSTSGDNETDTPIPSHKSSPTISFMDAPPKSALKKSSSNSFPVSSSSSSSKNVTFSAFATVQMVDR